MDPVIIIQVTIPLKIWARYQRSLEGWQQAQVCNAMFIDVTLRFKLSKRTDNCKPRISHTEDEKNTDSHKSLSSIWVYTIAQGDQKTSWACRLEVKQFHWIMILLCELPMSICIPYAEIQLWLFIWSKVYLCRAKPAMKNLYIEIAHNNTDEKQWDKLSDKCTQVLNNTYIAHDNRCSQHHIKLINLKKFSHIYTNTNEEG